MVNRIGEWSETSSVYVVFWDRFYDNKLSSYYVIWTVRCLSSHSHYPKQFDIAHIILSRSNHLQV